jgi:HlyD family secretion protein
MAKIVFRKAARPAPPERMDHLIQPVAAREWLGLAALALLTVAAFGWGILGSVALRANGQAVIVRTGGVQNVIAPSPGVLMKLRVRSGDIAKPGQVIADLAQPLMNERIRNAMDALELARRERDYTVESRSRESSLELESIEKMRASLNAEIADAMRQTELAKEQVLVQERLFAEGIVTKLQVIGAQLKVAEQENRIARARAELSQLEPREHASRNAPDSMRMAHDIKVTGLDAQLKALTKEFALSTQVRTTYGGQVLEVRTYEGATVAVGSPIVTLQSQTDSLETLAFVPADVAKEISPGMAAELSPANIRREEFGYLRAKVLGIADYPASRPALMRHFENESLVESLMSRGPVTEVRIALEEDASTPSGFRWSSSQGPPVKITGGTLGSVRIVTRRVRPIALVLPFLKAKLGIS